MVDPTVVERRHDELEPMFSLASLNKRLERPYIRDLNNDNSASSQNVPGLALFSSFPPRPLSTNPSMRVRTTYIGIFGSPTPHLQFLVSPSLSSNSRLPFVLRFCRPVAVQLGGFRTVYTWLEVLIRAQDTSWGGLVEWLDGME